MLTALWKNAEGAFENGVSVYDTLPRLLSCLSHGLILAVICEDKVVGFCAVSLQSDGVALIHYLPRGEIVHDCMKQVRSWAVFKGINELQLVTNRLNGSNFRYIEGTLGFHRKAMLFSKQITPNG